MADSRSRPNQLLIFVILVSVIAAGVFAQKAIVLPDLGKPHQIAVEENDLYVFDEADYSLHVYTISPFALRLKIGKKGDGPHDFKYLPFVYVQTDSLVCTDFTKTVWFSKSGEVMKVKEYTDLEGFDMNSEMLLIPAKENFVRITADHKGEKRHVTLLDPEFRSIKELYEGPFTWKKGAPVHYRTDTTCHDGLILISDTQKDFYIAVFDHKGKDLFSVRLGRSDEKPAQPLLHQYCVSGDRIYAVTNTTKDSKTEMIILDLEGNIIESLYLPLLSKKSVRGVLRYDLFDVDQKTLYEIIQNQKTGNWELVITELDI